jgi:hypothetical protein
MNRSERCPILCSALHAVLVTGSLQEANITTSLEDIDIGFMDKSFTHESFPYTLCLC